MLLKQSKKIRAVIIDDQELVRIGIRTALEMRTGIEIVGEGAGQSEALALTQERQPDIVLLGLNRLNGSGLGNGAPLPVGALIRALLKAAPTNILILSRYTYTVLVQEALRAGARGYLPKDEAMRCGDTLFQAVVEISDKRKLWLSPSLSANLDPTSLPLDVQAQLTRRRIEMMQAIADNPQMTLTQVAGSLGIAESTLRNNLSAVSRALDTASLNGSLIECLRLGVIQLSPV